MDIVIYFFDSIFSSKNFTKDQKYIDTEKFIKSNSKEFYVKDLFDSKNQLISIEEYKTFISKNKSYKKDLYISAFSKLYQYKDKEKYLYALYDFKYVEKKRNISKSFDKFMIVLFYDVDFISKKKDHTDIKLKINEVWNQEQLKFIQEPLKDMSLLGIPGGGKTRTIIGKIDYCIKNNTITLDGFIVLTHTNNTLNDFLDNFDKRYDERVRTVHSMAGYVLSIFNTNTKKTTQSVDTCVYKATQLIENVDLKKYKFFKNVTLIIVDESQDISKTQYNFIKKISKKLDCALILVGDGNQEIYGFQNASSEFLLNHSENKIELVKNYRSTPEIVNILNLASPIKRENNIEAIKKSEGSIPRLIIDNLKNCLISILEIIENKNQNETIAILGPTKKSRIIGNSYANFGLNTISNFLVSNKIDVNICYDDSEKIELSQKKKLLIKKGGVNILTIHGSKGLEFDTVILINYHFTSFTRNPTMKEYEQLKKLWYVALSRAKKNLIIYALTDKAIWPNHQLYENLMQSNIKSIIYPELIFKENNSSFFSWTGLISDKTIIEEERLSKLQDSIKLEYKFDKNFNIYPFEKYYSKKENENISNYLIFQDNNKLSKLFINDFNYTDDPIEYDEYQALYGIWAEETFYYGYRNDKFPKLIELENMVNYFIQFPSYLHFELTMIVKKLNKYILSLDDINEYNEFFVLSNEFKYFINTIDMNKHPFIFCHIENNDQYFDINYLKNKINDYNSRLKQLTTKDIFDICLFHYQYKNEKKILLQYDFTDHVNKLKNYDKNIREYASKLEDGYIFQYKKSLKILPITGVIDAYNPILNKLIEIKFSKEREPKFIHMFQLLGYNEMINRNSDMYILNLYHLVSHKIESDYDRFYFYYKLSKYTNTFFNKCCWLYDLETTGAITNTSLPKITQIHIQELTKDIVPISTLVKIGNLVYDESTIEKITGINRFMCNKFGEDIELVISKIEKLISRCDDTCRFIAHNGNKFDHVIIRSLINKSLEFNTLDSLSIFPLFIDDEIKSKKLVDLYKLVFKKDFELDAHQADNDVIMMKRIFLKLGFDSKKICELN